jgi:alpha-N-arabinofuranosidase
MIVDEWGSYWKSAEPGLSRLLFQQSSLRDAILASLTLNIFNNHCDRIQMANLAQMVNVLQSLILTEGDMMTCTPTYHVFEMFSVHQNARFLPIEIFNKVARLQDGKEVPIISASASRDMNGVIHISLVNIDLILNQNVVINLPFTKMTDAKIRGRILTAKKITDYNEIGGKEQVKPSGFSAFKSSLEKIQIELPAKSVVILSIDSNNTTKL